MTRYLVYGRTKQTRTTELARIVDEGETIRFTLTSGLTWGVSRDQLNSLLCKYAQLGYRVRINRPFYRRAA